MSTFIDSLLKGYKDFKENEFPNLQDSFSLLAEEGQNPKVLFISCCDSRVDPGLIFQAKPGDLFVVRNVASLVPPFESDDGYHGVSAAVEFAVTGLNVEHIIVMGHTMCGGINAMLNGFASDKSTFIAQWMRIGNKAKEMAMRANCAHENERVDIASRYAALTSLDNLRTFPWVADRESKGTLTLHAWQFDIKNGNILRYDQASNDFIELSSSL